MQNLGHNVFVGLIMMAILDVGALIIFICFFFSQYRDLCVIGIDNVYSL